MSDVYVVAPPAASLWDLPSVVAGALEVLRLGAGDVDVPRVQAAAEAIVDKIDQFLDSPDPLTVNPSMLQAAVAGTVNEYRKKDAPFGVANAWSADTVAFRIPNDPLAGSYPLLEPYKRRAGIG